MLGLNRGYTLLELMVTVAIAAVVAALAAPAFNNVIEKQRVRSAADALISSLSLARSEAITRNSTVTVAQKNSSWTTGWTLVAGGTTLRDESGVTGVTITGSAGSFQFSNSGRATASMTFSIVPDSGDTSHQRCVSLSLSGKPRSAEGGC